MPGMVKSVVKVGPVQVDVAERAARRGLRHLPRTRNERHLPVPRPVLAKQGAVGAGSAGLRVDRLGQAADDHDALSDRASRIQAPAASAYGSGAAAAARSPAIASRS